MEEITRHARKIGLKRLTDLSLAATLLGRKELASGRTDLARHSLETAVALDPDLPEARWGLVSTAARTRRWGELVSGVPKAVRATLTDREARRVFLARLSVVGVLSLAAAGLALVALLAVAHGRRLLHDLKELAARHVPASAETVAAVALLLSPLILSLDVVWFALALFVATFGYASRSQRLAAAAGVLALVPVLPVLDRVGFELAGTASPIFRGSEALAESRYDQRVLDDLEAVKNVLPEDADVRFLLGRLYQALGQNDRAVAEYTMGAQVAPSDTRCLVNRGNIRFVDGDFGSAQEDFQAALDRDARDVPARYNLSLVYAETFRTVEAAQTLQEARALDARQVQRFQDQPSLVKVVSLGYPVGEARQKIRALSGDPRSRRLLGHFRTYRAGVAWATPLLWAALLAVPAAVGLDTRRRRGRGYAEVCQKCGRTFCRRCKPMAESALLCSQCVHVYLKKDGVSIETKLLKVEEVKRRRSWAGALRIVLNVPLPGAAAFFDGRAGRAAACLGLFSAGVVALAGWSQLVVGTRPGGAPAWATVVLPAALAASGFVLGQLSTRRRAG